MSMTRSTSSSRDSRPSSALLWFVLIGGGVAWFARFLVIWVIAEFGCVSGVLEIGGMRSPLALLGLASLPFLAIGVGAVVVGWRALKALPQKVGDDPQAAPSARFMLRTGVGTSAVFVFIMLVEAVPIFFFLDECRSFTTIFG